MTGKTWDSKTAELRDAIASAKSGRPNAHVPMELRKRTVELVDAGRERGIGRKEIATALGIHQTTISNWQQQLGSQKRFVRARVVARRETKVEEAKSPSMRRLRVMVIDGLDLAALEVLLRSRS